MYDRPDPILPIADLPKGLRGTYNKFVEAINDDNLQKARALVKGIIAHYVNNKVEVPAEFEATYMRLYMKELAGCTPTKN